MGGSDVIVDAYRASTIQMAGMAVAIYAVQMLLRMRAEEADGPLEQILGTAVSRSRWMISHVINAALGSLALLLIYAIGVGLTAGAVVGDVPSQLGDMLVAGMVQVPAILVISGVVVAVTALLPRWAGAVCWTIIIVFILLGPLFGAATFQLPEWTQNLSPFAHTPKLPGADVTAVPVVALIAIAAALAAAGVATFRRRNLTLPA
jgi:ABC-2 type transport system permease protein